MPTQAAGKWMHAPKPTLETSGTHACVVFICDGFCFVMCCCFIVGPLAFSTLRHLSHPSDWPRVGRHEWSRRRKRGRHQEWLDKQILWGLVPSTAPAQASEIQLPYTKRHQYSHVQRYLNCGELVYQRLLNPLKEWASCLCSVMQPLLQKGKNK